ncbi:hypothetical protein K1719_002305 [Acacia pycnantha]|nr:hypothetical protein K1719_002305 [Acacia pycnantha]
MEKLPDDLKIEILLRLPIKSKCASKSWLSLISDPTFPKLHFFNDPPSQNCIFNDPQHYNYRFPYRVRAEHDPSIFPLDYIAASRSSRDSSRPGFYENDPNLLFLDFNLVFLRIFLDCNELGSAKFVSPFGGKAFELITSAWLDD